jgi:hypothetical protein
MNSTIVTPLRDNATLRLMRANTARSLRPATCGLELRCLSGLLVVTQKGDRDDHELYPGDEFRTSSRGLVVAWAILDSGFVVRTDAGALRTRRAA